jgi:hypothetical protein
MAKYKVVGPHAVAGVAPGGVVELEGELIPHLVEVGHVAPVATKSPQKSDQTEPKDGES